MRFTINSPMDGQRRIVKKFLVLPTRIDNEVRWLEWARIIQRYNFAFGWLDYDWYDIEAEK